MPLPPILGWINQRLTNPILWPVVARLPRSGFGRIVHIGRLSGRVYRTPMLGFRHGDRLVFALTYGPGAQWVQNVLAAGECDFETRSQTFHLSEPRLFRDADRRSVPPKAGWVLGMMKAYDFVEMRVLPAAADAARSGRDRSKPASRGSGDQLAGSAVPEKRGRHRPAGGTEPTSTSGLASGLANG